MAARSEGGIAIKDVPESKIAVFEEIGIVLVEPNNPGMVSWPNGIFQNPFSDTGIQSQNKKKRKDKNKLV